jgi:exopolysaccharide production protein ExoZ
VTVARSAVAWGFSKSCKRSGNMGAVTKSFKGSRLHNIQVLRFFAAFAVVFAHVALPRYSSQGVKSDLFASCAIGVDLFFVISGFIMMSVTDGLGGARSAFDFMVRRFTRVWPLWAIFTGVAYWLSGRGATVDFWLQTDYPPCSTEHVISSLTFTNFTGNPTYAIGWTLIYEFWFYVSVAICVALRARRSVYFGGFAIAVLVVQLQAVLRVPAFINTVFHPFMLEFIMGVALFFIHTRPRFRSVPVLLVTAALAVLFLAFALLRSHPGPYERVFVWGGASVVVVACALQLEGRIALAWILVFLGDASYSLYLTHWLVVTTFPSLLDVYGYSEIGPFTFIALNVFISLVLAAGVFILLERPLSWICKQAFRPRPLVVHQDRPA